MEKLILIIALILSLSSVSLAKEASLPSDKNCVAYKTTKKMFFIANVDIFGLNCQIQVASESKPDGQYLKVTMPVESFKSGDADRDEEVTKILGGAQKLALVFEGKFEGKEQLKQEKFEFPGVLSIKGEGFPVTLHMTVEKEHITFSLETTFSYLKVIVDSVGPGGLIARPKDALKLIGKISKETISSL